MKITKHGWAVIEGDTHLSKWVEDSGLIDHGQDLYGHYKKLGISPGNTVVDVGACLGDTTVPLAEAVGPEGRVFAFEPNPETFACLVYNTHRYPQVRCFPLALSSGPDSIVYLQPNLNLGATFMSKDTKGKAAVCTQLDNFCLDGVRFIKIDVEGCEIDVLKGAEETINLFHPLLKVETAVHASRFDTTREELYDWLGHHRYECSPPIKDLEKHPQYDIIAKPKFVN